MSQAAFSHQSVSGQQRDERGAEIFRQRSGGGENGCKQEKPELFRARPRIQHSIDQTHSARSQTSHITPVADTRKTGMKSKRNPASKGEPESPRAKKNVPATAAIVGTRKALCIAGSLQSRKFATNAI